MVAPLRALLSIDTEGYSKNPDAALPTLRIAMLNVTEQAIKRSGLIGAWRAARVNQSTGDGFLAVLPHDTIPTLIYPFADHLQRALTEAAPGLRTLGLALRLRVSLHCGLVDDGDPVTAPVSSATNVVSRLLDSVPVKDALRLSDPVVTLAAMIVSAEVFEKYVQGGHSILRPSQFQRVRAKVKQFEQVAYLYVPAPSTADEAAADGESPGSDAASTNSSTTPPGPASAGSSSNGVSINGNGSQNAIGNQVSGNFSQNRS